MITAEDFVTLTGYIPHQDDLDRANCPLGPESGHGGCGVCPECNRIRWNVCICQPHINSEQALRIVTDTQEDLAKVTPWLAEVNELLAQELGPEAKWSNTGGNDHWHDAYDEDQTPQEAVTNLLDLLTYPSHSKGKEVLYFF